MKVKKAELDMDMSMIENTNKKVYYLAVALVILAMLFGLCLDNPYFIERDIRFLVHAGLIAILAACLILYPKFENRKLRIAIIATASAYFYAVFFFYPDTWSTFVYICLIPLLSIFFFDPKLFYFSMILNGFAVTAAFAWMFFGHTGPEHPFIEHDLPGNIINFIGSQILMYMFYYLTYLRMKKQQAYYEQIQQAERIKTAGQLAAAVAHEIRNPLTVVKGFLQLYEQESARDAESRKHFSLMIGELNTAEQVISQFLTMSRPEGKVAPEPVSVKKSLESVVSLLHSYGLLHDNEIQLSVEGDFQIAANHMEFKQLCINIVKNAIEASRQKEVVRIEAKQAGNAVEIQVADHGNGMSEQEVRALGTPFYSLKSKGTGLGLMICFSIVRKYNGTLVFQSEEGAGTTVTIRFPAYEAANESI